MRNTGWHGKVFLSMMGCAALAFGTAEAATVSTTGGGQSTAKPFHIQQFASRDMTERYYQAYRLIGSHVLNLDGKRIGKVSSIVLDDQGDVTQVMIALADTGDVDGGSIAISPHRAEVVSTTGALVTVIRIDLSREELVQAQLVRLKSNARAPAQREAGKPDPHVEYGPFY